ncbi:MAG TPA: TonB-dependent receptor [bacterium]|nr:TonB-dependent receptor [bacterium]
MMRSNRFLFIGIFLFLSAAAHAGTTGKISGRITSKENGEPIPGTNILLEGTSLGALAALDGYYHIINIPPGKYVLIIRAMGYGMMRFENVRVSVDATTSLSAALAPTVIEGEEVTVVASKPMVQKDLTSTSARVAGDQMEMLPVESVNQVVELQAGVVNGHFRGGRLGEVAFLIDGLAVNDAYTGGQMIALQANSVAEVEVISGTFNAEYGQAMSGVVNVVSKDPEGHFSGQISGYLGAYLSGRTLPFVAKNGAGLKREEYYQEMRSYLDLAAPSDVYDLEGTLSGPLWKDRLNFFSSFRYNHDSGYLWGRRIFNPSDSSYLPSLRENWRVQATGDGAFVPMSWGSNLTAHAKWIAKLWGAHKLTYEYIHEDGEGQSYNHKYKYNPDGRPTNYSTSHSHMLHMDYIINKNGFINLKAARLKKRYESYLYSSPYDLRYMPISRLSIGSGPSFYMAGTDMNHAFRTTATGIVKADLTYQVDRYNQLKGGLEARSHELYVLDYAIRLDRQTDWKPQPVEKDNTAYNEFTKTPMEVSVYLQDRIEWSYFIMNLGLRYDWFKPEGVYPLDLMKPVTSEKAPAKNKSQWSPRFGIALPVSEQSVLHLSYGLFFQIPSFAYLYLNPLFKIPVGSFSTIGNTDLQPQKTATYEIGLQQAIGPNLGVTLTGYYKDIRNLLGMEVYTILPSFDKYARYVNRDYGQVFGFTVALEQRGSSYLSTTLDYTYQLAEGNSSDPNDVYIKSTTTPPTEITKQLIFLDWDRTHSLNLTSTVHNKDIWNIGLIAKLGSGFPYTPDLEGYYPSRENDERRPPTYSFDLNLAYTLKFGRFKTTLFSNIYNVFDIRNAVDVYLDTGSPEYSIDEHFYTDDMVRCVNTVRDYYFRPHYFSAPRRIVAGAKLEF